jgi:copper transport protein
MRRLARTLLLVALAAGLAPAAASAHAQLESTAPERGAVLDRRPSQVTFDFSEPVEGSFGAVRVFDATGKEVQDGEPFHPGDRASAIGVRLADGLADGTYTATYRVVSADSHIVSGGYAFSIGRAGAAGATVAELLEGDDAGPVTGTALSVARGLQYLSIALALGALAFLVLVVRRALPALAAARPDAGWPAATAAFASRLRAIVLAAAAVGALSAAAAIVLQGAEAGGTSAWTALDADVIRETLATRFGTVWGIGVLAWIALGALTAATMRAPRTRDRTAPDGEAPHNRALAGLSLPPAPWPLALVALAPPAAWLVLLPGLGGHAGSTSPTAVLVPANAIHVAAMALWAGGLAALLLVLPAATRQLADQGDRSRLLAGALARFSPLALASVAAILATGILQSLLQLDDVAALVETGFGRAIVVKSLLLVALIGLGAQQRRSVLPRLRAAAEQGEAPGAGGLRLRAVLRGEIALLLGVLAATAALAATSPSRGAATGPYDATQTSGPIAFQITVDPAAAGPNTVHVYLFAGDGSPFRAVRALTISATEPQKGIGPLRETPDRAGPGHWTLAALPLSAPGSWELRVAARVSDFDEHATTFDVPVR